MITEPVNAEVWSRYLTLSVFAQAVVEALTRVGCPDDEARGVLGDAVEILGDIERGEIGSAPGQRTGLRPFRTFEQLTTLYEVLGPEESAARDRLRRLHQILVSIRQNPEASDATATSEALEVFRCLAVKAQERSQRPSEGVPERVLELCRQVKGS